MRAAPEEFSQTLFVNAYRAPAISNPAKLITVTAYNSQDARQVQFTYFNPKLAGEGCFAKVYVVQRHPTGESVALKEMWQDRKHKNRELELLRVLDHPNVCKLEAFFATYDGPLEGSNISQTLVLEYLPSDIYRLYHRSMRETNGQTRFNPPLDFPLRPCVRLILDSVAPLDLKCYAFQMFRSLAYIHGMNVCHRDIKPQNLLVDPMTGILKLCDFGSAKELQEGMPNVAYTSTRFYRAPELCFGNPHYSTPIDMWSAGCVLAEMLLGLPMFRGATGVDQLVEIIKIRGTPSLKEISSMNPAYHGRQFPSITAMRLSSCFREQTDSDIIDLIDRCWAYSPYERISASEATDHRYFDQLHQPGIVFSSGQPLPPLFAT